MNEVPLSALDARQLKLVENARVALRRGDFEYAVEAAAQVLRQAPACAEVRRMQWTALRRRAAATRRGILAKLASGVSSAPFLFKTARREPAATLAMAESVLEKHPDNVAALKLLGSAAQALGWRETAAFALEAVCEVEPGNRAHMLALGDAWLEVGRATDALRLADDLLRDAPADGDALNLMRKASVAQTVSGGAWAACRPE